jgi:hypothetical protein
MYVFRSMLRFYKYKIRIIQWFQRQDNSSESHKTIADSVVLARFWREFKGGRSLMKIGDIRKASEQAIREFLLFTTCCFVANLLDSIELNGVMNTCQQTSLMT